MWIALPVTSFAQVFWMWVLSSLLAECMFEVVADSSKGYASTPNLDHRVTRCVPVASLRRCGENSAHPSPYLNPTTASLMKGVTILEDQANKKRYLQIDIAELDKRREQIEDMMDGLIAEQRGGQPSITLDALEKKLRKQGKL